MIDETDHRQIARRLRLLHFQDEAPGMVFWHPRGLQLYRSLEDAIRRQLVNDGYEEIRTPQLLRRSIWEASGHWTHFPEGIYKLDDGQDPGMAIKPVSCPGHVQMYRHVPHSHRELPIRWAEFGVVHRKEPSGTLQGLFRLRQFTQDDGHIFCREEQAVEEITRFCRSIGAFYRQFGFERVQVGLSTRPAHRFGTDAQWDRAESSLALGARQAGFDFAVQAGEGAFYGPKLEFLLPDALGRIWQCGTIQADFVLPERFGLEYVDERDLRQRPMLLHRALYGSLERFMAIVLEHHGGRLPTWLAPDQVVVLPIGPAQANAAADLARRLNARGVRVRVDLPRERLGRRIAEAHELGIPWMLVLGERELATGSISVRHDGRSVVHPVDDLTAEVVASIRPPGLGVATGCEL